MKSTKPRQLVERVGAEFGERVLGVEPQLEPEPLRVESRLKVVVEELQ